METVYAIFGYTFWISIALYFLLHHRSSRPGPRFYGPPGYTGNTVMTPFTITEEYQPISLTRPRLVTMIATNPHNHPYDELGMDELVEHLYDKHFEIANMGAERDWAPATWRKNHANDHGMVLR